jgi:hypothetical protein
MNGLAFFIGAEEIIQPAACTFGLAGRVLRHTRGRVAEERVQARSGLLRRGRDGPRPCVGAWLKITAEIRVLLVLHYVGNRLTTAIGYAGVKEFTQTADMQIRMTRRALGQPRQRQRLTVERSAAFPADQGL